MGYREPPTEQLRLQRLAELNLLNTDRDSDFDDITRVAGELFHAPISAISFIGRKDVIIKSVFGLERATCPRDYSFCDHLICQQSPEPLIVKDAAVDERFSQNPLVLGEPGIRFYAGAQLTTSDGIPLGVICVIDRKPVEPTQKQMDMLKILAKQVMNLIESRDHQHQLQNAFHQLKQTEQLSRFAGTMARVGYWRVELPEMKITWSDTTRAIHEVDDSYVPSVETAINFYAPESIPLITQAVNDAINEGKSYDLQLSFITAKNKLLRIRTIGAPEYRDGKIVAIAGAFQDLTSIIATENKAREINQRLEKVSAQTPGFLYQFMLRPNGTSSLPYASNGITNLFRVTPEQVRDDATDVFKVIHPDDYDRVMESIQESARTMNVWTSQFRVQFPDGTCEWLDGKSSPEQLPDGSIIWHGFIYNVSNRVASEHRIRENEQRLSVALEGSNIGLWDWSLWDGQCYFSDCWYTMLGYQPGELPMHLDTWKAILHPEDQMPVMDSLQRHFEGKEPVYRVEQRLRQKDGTYRWIHDVGRIVERDANGRPTRMIGVHIDIDSQKRVQDELTHAKYQADIANRTKSEFLANMSHEIRTPLTAILGFSEMLRETHTPQHNKYVADIIQRNGEHLLGVLNDILDLSKIEAQKLRIEILPVDLRGLIEEALSFVTSKAEQKGIQLINEYDPSLPKLLKTDPTRIRQILLNLLSNAIKFTTVGGITIRTRLVNTTENKVQVYFEIADTGIGMDPEQLKRVFNPFEQADQSTTRKFGGTGLGLTITRRLTQILGGDINVTSHVNRGTTFRVGFDFEIAETDSQIDAANTALITSTVNPNLCIMVVDDAIDNVRLLQFMLKKIGIEPVVAYDGQQAIDLRVQRLKSGTDFDLIILDMQMPIKDGFSTAAELRGMGYEGRIVALTANAMSDARMKCLAAGCDDFLTKPIDSKLLISTINRQQQRQAA